MDPYLEEPTRWGGFHSRLLNTIADDLADRLAPRFIVEIETHVSILTPAESTRRPIVPDGYPVRGGGGAATAEADLITAPTLVEPLYELEIRERIIEIRDAAQRQVVTTIEVLSPFNKAAGSPGRAAFLRKREAVMASPVHWLEIDLLRAGECPPEVAGRSDYYALLRRGGAPAPFAVWFVDLRDPLPRVAVPLGPAEADVPLDLQALVAHVYARGHYADSLDYAAEPPPPRLAPADAAWASARCRDWLAARAGNGDEPGAS
jgi:hypothetical protein